MMEQQFDFDMPSGCFSADVLNGNVVVSVLAAPPQQPQIQPQCANCALSFDSADAFFQHWLECHCKEPNLPSTSSCPTCNHTKDASMKNKLDVHVCRQNNNVKTALKRKAEDKSTCQRQSKKAVVNGANASHFACGVCTKDVRTVTSFFLHWLDSHHAIMDVLEEVWRCGLCVPNKLFPSRENGLQHALEEHAHAAFTREERFVCDFPPCREVEFVDRLSFEKHRDVHSNGNGPFGLCCSECGHFANSEDELVLHVSERHESHCGVCRGRVWNNHVDSHTASEHRLERIWNRSDKLQLITKASDDSALTVSTGSPSSTSPPISPTSSSRLVSSGIATPSSLGGSRCTACQKLFTSEKLLEKHYAQNHDFQCKFCHLRMDKDVYGDHLRQHLASQRKKANVKQ